MSTWATAKAACWKAGTAKAVITPKEPIWMAGYSSRNRPAAGTLHDLQVRVLAIEDSAGKRAVVVCTDLLGIPRSIAANVSRVLRDRFKLSRSQVMLNASHTHCGPVLRGALYDAYPLSERQKLQIDAYSSQLESTIVRTVEEALGRMVPATLSTGIGSADFAVNRRNNREPDVPALREKRELQGPSDHSVPVLSVKTLDGKLLSVVFQYACHNTTLGIYEWNGDYAGFAETNLETAHPGVVAMFAMGCGGDQNPLPRRTVELCRQYGRTLADSVETVLARPMESLAPTLQTAFAEATLHLGAVPTSAELKPLAAGKESYITRWASRLLAELDAGRPFPRSYPYPVEVWRLGGRQLWIALGGEVVVDYELSLKGRFGPATWVTGYSNDVMAYIPSRRVLDEDKIRHGYEGNTSMMVYGMPAQRWGDEVETTIVAAVDELVRRVDASKLPPNRGKSQSRRAQ